MRERLCGTSMAGDFQYIGMGLQPWVPAVSAWGGGRLCAGVAAVRSFFVTAKVVAGRAANAVR